MLTVFFLSKEPIATNFNNYLDITGNQAERAKSYLSEALLHSFAESKKNHVDFYRRYLTRVSLDLGEDLYKNVTTDKRVENFKETHDAHLVATYFQIGRYLHNPAGSLQIYRASGMINYSPHGIANIPVISIWK